MLVSTPHCYCHAMPGMIGLSVQQSLACSLGWEGGHAASATVMAAIQAGGSAAVSGRPGCSQNSLEFVKI